MITVDESKLREVLDDITNHMMYRMSDDTVTDALDNACTSLRSMLEQKPSAPTHFICHGHLYTWPSEDNFCANPEDHIPLYAAPVLMGEK